MVICSEKFGNMMCERCNAEMEEKNDYEIYIDETDETEYYKRYVCPKCDLSRTKRVFYLKRK